MRTSAEAADELEAFGLFYGALAARRYYGEHVCLAVHPDEANGSVEDLVERGVDQGAAITAGWAEQILDAVDDRSSVQSILTALGELERRLDLEEFARVVEQQILHGAMLGVLDSEWEREHDEDIAPARFAEPQPFSGVPYEDARRLFDARQVLPRPAFDALEQGARRQAFTVARMASAEMLNVTKAELARQLAHARDRPVVGPDGVARREGFNLRTFRKFAKERLESAGWTPANKSHVETVFRTNVIGALASGRFVEMRRPEVLSALPYWQIRGVSDSRTRPTHKAAFGIILPADHPFWRTAYPPFGYNCRCGVTARSARWLERSGKSIGPVPKDLPDPGFDSGTDRLISVPSAALEPARPEQPAAPKRPPWMHSPPPPEPVTATEFERSATLYEQRVVGAGEFLKTSDRFEVLEKYTDSDYLSINRSLLFTDAPVTNQTRQQVADLQHLLAQARVAGHAFEGAVYRGVAVPPELLARWASEEVIEFAAFTSTTTVERMALLFTSPNRDEVRVLFQIRQRSGVPVGTVSSTPGESEILLPSGKRFRRIGPVRVETRGSATNPKIVNVIDLEELD
jgi:SPP1 gp7 family putative phage head morphogenesis protein